MISPVPAATPLSESSPPRPRWYQWRRRGFNFLILSILAHILFGVVATYLIVQNFQAKRKQTYAGPPIGPSAPMRALEHRVQAQKRQQIMRASMPVKRVTTTSNMKVVLPAMPEMPKLDSPISPTAMVGMGSLGMSMGMGLGSGGGGGGGGGGGKGLSLFGFHGTSGGLEGTFYDYKMGQNYQPIKPFDNNTFGQMVRVLLPIDGPWHPEQPYQHYRSPAVLHSRYFLFPAISDTEAGAAFQSPRSGPGRWLAVYHGRFSSTASGSFRFVGFGDNVMIVQIGKHMVLDASDHNYSGQHREGLGEIKFPKKSGTPLFAGEWFSLESGEPKDISIAVGDEGGIFCSGLFVQPRGTTYAQGENGIPKLPAFILGTPTDDDKQLLGKSFPPVCLQGPYFQATAARFSDGDIFSH